MAKPRTDEQILEDIEDGIERLLLMYEGYIYSQVLQDQLDFEIELLLLHFDPEVKNGPG